MRLVRSLVLIVAVSGPAHAQSTDEPMTVLPHPDRSWWVSGQINLIGQRHAAFPALYDGEQSFRSDSERALSFVLTLYTGVRLPHGWELLFDVEAAGGHG